MSSGSSDLCIFVKAAKDVTEVLDQHSTRLEPGSASRRGPCTTRERSSLRARGRWKSLLERSVLSILANDQETPLILLGIVVFLHHTITRTDIIFSSVSLSAKDAERSRS